MEVVLYLVLFFGGLGVLLLIGLPVAIAFTLVNLVGVYAFWGGAMGLGQLILSIDSSVSNSFRTSDAWGTPPTDGGKTPTSAPVCDAMEFGVFRSK